MCVVDCNSGIEVEELGEVVLGDGHHEVAGDGVALVEVALLVLLHEHVDLAHHLDELELVRAAAEHGHEALDERRAVDVPMRDEAAHRRVPDEEVGARRQRRAYRPTVDEVHERVAVRARSRRVRRRRRRRREYVTVHVAIGRCGRVRLLLLLLRSTKLGDRGRFGRWCCWRRKR